MFTSYAQNLEDVILWRVLRSVENGFYIDVGANHPIEDSVTLGFYEQGWRGINVEPVESHVRQLRRERPRDVNLQIALGSRRGSVELFETRIRGLSTTSADVAQMHREQGIVVGSYEVPMVTLADVCEEHVTGEIHFLKIDVEGAEREVLEGADFRRFRPWIIVVEATYPNSRRPRYEEWEHLVLAAGYTFAYFDGINRFYARSDRPDLIEGLRLPPNVFDAFTFRLREGHPFAYPPAAKLQQIAELKDELTRTRMSLMSTQAELAAIQNSRSWRWTAPLRQVKGRVRGLAGRVLRKGTSALRRLVHRSPWLKRSARAILRSSPGIARIVGRLLNAQHAVEAVHRFEDLRSVRLMAAVAAVPQDAQPVVILEAKRHGR